MASPTNLEVVCRFIELSEGTMALDKLEVLCRGYIRGGAPSWYLESMRSRLRSMSVDILVHLESSDEGE